MNRNVQNLTKSRIPSTQRGRKTYEAILEGAIQVFSQSGFHATSVSEICRCADVANGSFYQYFPDKTDVLEEIIHRISRDFLGTIGSEKNPERLCDALFDFFETRGKSFQIFREAEFLEVPHPRDIFYDAVIDRLQENLNIGEAACWAFLGALTLTALTFGGWEGKPVQPGIRLSFFDVLQNGIVSNGWSLPAHFRVRKNISKPAIPEPEGRAERTRQALLLASRECFAKTGYSMTHITHITQAAGAALGTFYFHFKEKREILAEVTTAIRAEMQKMVFDSCRGLTHRMDIELQAFLTFLEYLIHNHDIYRIVREAEFAEPEIGRGYYELIRAEWAKLSRQAMATGQIRTADPEVTACILMGAESNIGMRWILWEDGHHPPEKILREAWSFLCYGFFGPR
ncbi:MAG: TetR/AcrR family transcriptional regulator [Candidatus Riflebacteria bacterium]|nr:TetR/AcrR family transcriptional regulator [Candidatus Riflebacteria bacterium]